MVNNEKTLSVITTTYNRAYCLHQVYESLCRQTNDDFLWMIIDDGSIDETRELVNRWIKEDKIQIEYYYKQNGGMHTARNLAYELVKTELNVIIDSDDWMTDDGVEKIVRFWKKNKRGQFYGIIANNISAKDGSLIGTAMPKDVPYCTMTELFGKYGVKGDKKIILRSELSKQYPFPEFTGEKFFPASYKYTMLDIDYKLLVMNESVCFVDYNEDSMTFDKIKQYKTCAKGFAFYRNEMIRITNDPKQAIRESIHYIAESKLAGEKHYIRNSSKPFYTILCIPVGILYYIYLENTKKKY